MSSNVTLTHVYISSLSQVTSLHQYFLRRYTDVVDSLCKHPRIKKCFENITFRDPIFFTSHEDRKLVYRPPADYLILEDDLYDNFTVSCNQASALANVYDTSYKYFLFLSQLLRDHSREADGAKNVFIDDNSSLCHAFDLFLLNTFSNDSSIINCFKEPDSLLRKISEDLDSRNNSLSIAIRSIEETYFPDYYNVYLQEDTYFRVIEHISEPDINIAPSGITVIAKLKPNSPILFPSLEVLFSYICTFIIYYRSDKFHNMILEYSMSEMDIKIWESFNLTIYQYILPKSVQENHDFVRKGYDYLGKDIIVPILPDLHKEREKISHKTITKSFKQFLIMLIPNSPVIKTLNFRESKEFKNLLHISNDYQDFILNTIIKCSNISASDSICIRLDKAGSTLDYKNQLKHGTDKFSALETLLSSIKPLGLTSSEKSIIENHFNTHELLNSKDYYTPIFTRSTGDGYEYIFLNPGSAFIFLYRILTVYFNHYDKDCRPKIRLVVAHGTTVLNLDSNNSIEARGDSFIHAVRLEAVCDINHIFLQKEAIEYIVNHIGTNDKLNNSVFKIFANTLLKHEQDTEKTCKLKYPIEEDNYKLSGFEVSLERFRNIMCA